jgi:hypothetical protein
VNWNWEQALGEIGRRVNPALARHTMESFKSPQVMRFLGRSVDRFVWHPQRRRGNPAEALRAGDQETAIAARPRPDP